MKILQVHCGYRQSGGEETILTSERDLLLKAGHQVDQHVVSNPEGRAEAVFNLALAPWNPRARRRLEASILAQRPDVVHVHNTWFSLSPSIFATLDALAVPAVQSIHNYRLHCTNALLLRNGRPCEDCVGAQPWRGVLHRCYRDSFLASGAVAVTISTHRSLRTWERRVHRLVAHTEFAKRLLVKEGVPKERITVKPNFIFDDPRPRLQPPSSSSTFLFVGRLAPEKGVQLLLDAWRNLPSSPFDLAIAGDGPLRADLEQAAPPGVHFLGQLRPEEVRQQMRQARALLFPSMWYEGQPLVLIEALAMGLPLVATNLGGTAETLQDLGEASLVAPGDVAAWSAAIERLMEDPVALDARGAKSRAVWAAKHTPAGALAALERIYADVISLRSSC